MAERLPSINLGAIEAEAGPVTAKELSGLIRWLERQGLRQPQTSTQAGNRPGISIPPPSPVFPDLGNYFFLPGRMGGQVGYGSTAPGGFLKLRSTSASPKGLIYLGTPDLSAYDDVNQRLGIGTVTPSARLHVKIPTTLNQDALPNSDVTPFGGDFLSTEATWWQGCRDNFSDSDASKDVKYNFRSIAGVSRSFAVTLTTLTDPGVSSGHIIYFRVWRTANTSGTVSVVIELHEGATIIASTTLSNLTSIAATTYSYTLSAAEANAITDYSNLNLRCVMGVTGGSGADEFRCSWLLLRLPPSGSGTDGIAVTGLIIENNAANGEALLEFRNAAGSGIKHTAPSSVTTHTLTWPGTQGAASSFLKNDGSGLLSWDTTPGSHNLLSATHADTVPSTPIRGGIIVANSTPAWAQFAKGTADQMLMMNAGGTDPQWRSQSAIDHGALGGLADDDHTQYLLLVGRSPDQVVRPFNAAGIGLIIRAQASQTANLLAFQNSASGLMSAFSATGTLGIGTSPSANISLNASQVVTATAAQKLLNMSGEITDNTGGFQHFGSYYDLVLKGTGDYSPTEQIGFQSQLTYQGSNISAPDVTAAWFIANKTGTGPVGQLSGLVIYGEISNTGNVTQYNGMYIANPNRSTATLSSCNGLTIESITAGTNNYAIKSLGGLVYFAGKVGINLDPPTAQLHVVSSAAGTKGLIVKLAGSPSANAIEVQNSSAVDLAHIDQAGRLQTVVNGVTNPIFRDGGDTTKRLGISAAGITTATDRVLAALDMSGAIPVVGDDPPAVAAGFLGKVDATAQAAAIGSTNLTNGAKVGYYIVDYTLEDTTADATAGTIQFQINYTDDIGATTQAGAALILTATGRDRGSFQVYLASGELSYQTNLVGIIATSRYALRVRVTFLG